MFEFFKSKLENAFLNRIHKWHKFTNNPLKRPPSNYGNHAQYYNVLTWIFWSFEFTFNHPSIFEIESGIHVTENYQLGCLCGLISNNYPFFPFHLKPVDIQTLIVESRRWGDQTWAEEDSRQGHCVSGRAGRPRKDPTWDRSRHWPGLLSSERGQESPIPLSCPCILRWSVTRVKVRVGIENLKCQSMHSNWIGVALELSWA